MRVISPLSVGFLPLFARSSKHISERFACAMSVPLAAWWNRVYTVDNSSDCEGDTNKCQDNLAKNTSCDNILLIKCDSNQKNLC